MSAIINNQSELFPIPYSKVELTILKAGLRFYTEQCAAIPAPIVSRYYYKYYLLYWSRTYLLNSIKEGCIVHDGVAYRVIYGGNNTRGRILQSDQMTQFSLSFRAPRGVYELNPVVIVNRKSGEEN